MKHILLWLILANQGAVTADTWVTANKLKHGYVERNPIVRPITSLPKPAHFAVMEACAGLESFVAWKMKNSKHKVLRKVWWIPQSVSIGLSTSGAVYTSRH